MTLDVEGDRLLRDGEVIKLEPRLTRLLLCLARKPGHVVPVPTLLEAVWSDVVVTPESVYQAVAALRRALGDDGHHPTYIVNVPRKGYRLIAEVRSIASPSLAPPAREDTTSVFDGSAHLVPATDGAPDASLSVAARAHLEDPPPAKGGTDDAWQPVQGSASRAESRPPNRPASAWPVHPIRLAAILTTLVALTIGARLWLNPNPGKSAPPIDTAAGTTPATASERAPARPAVRKVLWVDDKPQNNERERDAMAALGVGFVLAQSTEEAVSLLESSHFDLVISDLHRPDEPNAGIVLLSHMRQRLGDRTPFVLYTRQCTPEQAMEVRALGALACTTQISGLMQSALVALESRP